MSSGPEQQPPPAGYQRRCPRCNYPVEEGAAYCPNCGADLRPKRGFGGWLVALAVVIALLVGGGLAYALKSGSNKTETTTLEKTVATSKSTSSSIGVSVTTPTRTETGPTTTVTSTTTTTTTTTKTAPSTTTGG